MRNMMKPVYYIALFSCIGLASLTGCEQTKEQLGLTRTMPDEFAVTKRAPLEMPPDFNLRPPSPGAQRPQEAAAELEAQKAILGTEGNVRTGSVPEGGESLILQQAGADRAQPDIRSRVDRETAQLEPAEKPVAERLLGWTMGGDNDEPASVVDPAAEAERIKKNLDEGAAVTEGETPTIEE